MDQGSPEWYAARIGKVTASRVADLMARTKTGYGASRANYMAELICERLTGQRAEAYVNSAMQWGTDTEPRAKAAYCFMQGEVITDCGFIDHPEIPNFGASPDGMIGDAGLIEIKCPNTATHLDFLLSKAIPGKYLTQMQVQMACTGRKWCDFVSFDPRLPEHLQLWAGRVARDNDEIARIKTEVVAFLAELEQKISQLKTDYAEAA